MLQKTPQTPTYEIASRPRTSPRVRARQNIPDASERTDIDAKQRPKQERVRIKRRGKKAPAKTLEFKDLVLRKLKPPAKGQVLYWDTVQSGLHLLVSYGGTKTFKVQFKLNGKYRSYAIGRLGENATDAGENFSVWAARERARADRALAAQGKDPRIAASRLTVRQAIERFIKEVARPTQRSWDQTEYMLLRGCRDWLDRPVSSIGRGECYEAMQELIGASKGPTARNRLARIKRLWSWLVEIEVLEHDTMRPIKLHIERSSSKRVYSDDELKAIWHAAGALAPDECAYVRLVMLLAPRKTAAAFMKWSDLDTQLTLWTTPFEFTKSKKTAEPRNFKTPLGSLAQSILKSLPRIRDDVFPSLLRAHTKKAKRPEFVSTTLERRMVDAGAPEDFGLHAFRHTVGTRMQEAGYNEFDVGLVLNNGIGGASVTGQHYMHGVAIKRKQELLQWWEGYVRGAVGQ